MSVCTSHPHHQTRALFAEFEKESCVSLANGGCVGFKVYRACMIRVRKVESTKTCWGLPVES